MMKINIADDSGTIISNLYRDETGAIIVNDAANHHKYIYQRQLERRIQSQQEEISEIKSMLTQILSNIRNNKE